MSNNFKATLYPGQKLSFSLIQKIVHKAYWPIYGEIRILEEISEIDHDKCREEGNCPEESGVYFSYVALIIYMGIANILLVNLLIAMFR